MSFKFPGPVHYLNTFRYLTDTDINVVFKRTVLVSSTIILRRREYHDQEVSVRLYRRLSLTSILAISRLLTISVGKVVYTALLIFLRVSPNCFYNCTRQLGVQQNKYRYGECI